MRCTTYCTANAYNTNDLVNSLREEGLEPKYFDDVVHIAKQND